MQAFGAGGSHLKSYYLASEAEVDHRTAAGTLKVQYSLQPGCGPGRIGNTGSGINPPVFSSNETVRRPRLGAL
jgi:hypothetical protein